MPTRTTDSSPSEQRREWLTPRALAEREGISLATARRWVDKGIVEVRRRGPRTGVRMRLAREE